MVMTWLLVATAAAGSLSPWQVTWNASVSALNAGDPAGCLAAIPAEPLSTEGSWRWWDLGYTCAVSASDLAAADTYRSSLGPGYRPRAALDIHHAWLKRGAGDPEAALELLVPRGWTSSHQQQVGHSLHLTLLSETGRWEEALGVAHRPGVDPRAQASFAQQLAAAGRSEDALGVFERACPELEDPELWGCASVIRLPGDGGVALVE